MGSISDRKKNPNKYPYDIFITTTLICTILECLIVKKKLPSDKTVGLNESLCKHVMTHSRRCTVLVSHVSEN